MFDVEALIEDVFRAGAGSQADDIKHSEKAYLNLQKHYVKQAKVALLALLEAEAVDFFEPDEELDNILVQTRAVPLSKVRELFDV